MYLECIIIINTLMMYNYRHQEMFHLGLLLRMDMLRLCRNCWRLKLTLTIKTRLFLLLKPPLVQFIGYQLQNGQTSVYLACIMKKTDVVELLVKSGANLKISDKVR